MGKPGKAGVGIWKQHQGQPDSTTRALSNAKAARDRTTAAQPATSDSNASLNGVANGGGVAGSSSSKKPKPTKYGNDALNAAIDAIATAPKKPPQTQQPNAQAAKKQQGNKAAGLQPKPKQAASDKEAVLFQNRPAAVPQTMFTGFNESDVESSSLDTARRVLESLLKPITMEEFFNSFWESKPLVVRRSRPNYYSEVFSTATMFELFSKHDIHFTKNVDVTLYENDERVTVSPPGRVLPPIAQSFLDDGCSLRLLNPHSYDDRVWSLLARLQEAFGAGAGANVYLTPCESQGFAPHYDDIDAFVLQLEGTKEWKLHRPRPVDPVLPFISSRDIPADQLEEPFITVQLNPGDLLYMPRGTIHQARTTDGKPSLHITISTCQKNSWFHLLEKAMPAVLEHASRSGTIDIRQSVPASFLHNGASARAQLSASMTAIHNSALTTEVVRDVFLREYLALTNATVRSDHIQLKSQVKFIRAHISALYPDTENDGDLLYHSAQNARLYRDEEPLSLVLPEGGRVVVAAIEKAYPAFVRINALPSIGTDEEGNDMRLEVVRAMFNQGVLFARV
ncbi:nucleolar protein 66 [Capsaspora owczarzaki ATCC 30864]|uniref:Bifunctional lysine-specific demethylase and histidyl-hydroxylase n=1 Tax=Capsaspora owczarzaki (strain ATCC 30864) TaxID=595528 RepID=A0A0D2WVT3_CAPO3|nr:nucleolar protein 66 [Capsaspora owczarzaki ATCC 30864]